MERFDARAARTGRGDRRHAGVAIRRSPNSAGSPLGLQPRRRGSALRQGVGSGRLASLPGQAGRPRAPGRWMPRVSPRRSRRTRRWRRREVRAGGRLASGRCWPRSSCWAAIRPICNAAWAWACAGLRQGAAAFFDGTWAMAETPPPAATPGEFDVPWLRREAGWKFVEHADGQVAVPLELPDLYLQAVVRPRQQGGLAVEAAFDRVEGLAAVCRPAIHVPAAQRGAAARSARAVAQLRAAGDTEPDCGWEVVLTPCPSARANSLMPLAAILAGCRLCGREVHVLAMILLCYVSWFCKSGLRLSLMI